MEWYETQRAGLGLAFSLAFEVAIDRVRLWPEGCARLGNSKFRFVRLRRFPYLVFFTVGPTRIEVIAVSHFRRKPGYWKKRRIE